MSKESPQFRCPLRLEVWSGKNHYSVKLGWDFVVGTPSADNIVALMTSLGKKADGVQVSRIGIDYLEVSSCRLSSLKRSVAAIAQKFDPADWAPGDGYLALFPEVIFPPTLVNSQSFPRKE